MLFSKSQVRQGLPPKVTVEQNPKLVARLEQGRSRQKTEQVQRPEGRRVFGGSEARKEPMRMEDNWG